MKEGAVVGEKRRSPNFVPFYPCNNSYRFIRAPRKRRKKFPATTFRATLSATLSSGALRALWSGVREWGGRVAWNESKNRFAGFKASAVVSCRVASGRDVSMAVSRRPGGKEREERRRKGGRTGVWKPSWSLHRSRAPSECQRLRSSVCVVLRAHGRKAVFSASYKIHEP